MRVFIKLMTFLFLTAVGFSENYFREDSLIGQIVFISDVDGVVRERIESIADPRVISMIESLLQKTDIDVTFILGTPIANNSSLQPWRRGNVSLNKVFGSFFKKEIKEGRVSVFGALGGHLANKEGGFEVIDEYPLEVSFEISSLLIKGFLLEGCHFGTQQQKELAEGLQLELTSLKLQELTQSTSSTAKEFKNIICEIRGCFDLEFRLINNGPLVETHTSNPPWETEISSRWFQKEMNKSQYLLSFYPAYQKKMATGFSKKEDLGFNYLMLSKTNKGISLQKHVEEKLKQYPDAFIITIGDTEVNFPMHEQAHLAFHEWIEKVWKNNPMSHFVLICTEEGVDKQQLEGTLKVLKLLETIRGKTFREVKELLKLDDSTKWAE